MMLRMTPATFLRYALMRQWSFCAMVLLSLLVHDSLLRRADMKPDPATIAQVQVVPDGWPGQ